MKLNLGCGYNKIPGFVNVDKAPQCNPDVAFDIEEPNWPWENDSVSDAVFNHSLEHMGQQSKVFLRIIQELYRVCADKAVVRINVPHPRHDNFIDDPTHVRIITPGVMSLFDRKQNLEWIRTKAVNTPLSMYLDVDFYMQEMTAILPAHYHTQLQSGKITNDEIMAITTERNNVVEEYRMVLIARKPPFKG